MKKTAADVGVALWFLFLALIGLVWIGALIWLVAAIVSYLGRH